VRSRGVKLGLLAHPENDELFFLLDNRGGLIAFLEKGASWAGILAFTSEDLARAFVARSHVNAVEIAGIFKNDPDAVASIVREAKRRAIRNLLIDLDYAAGTCTEVHFEGERLGAAHSRQFTPQH